MKEKDRADISFNEKQKKLLGELFSSLNETQVTWLSGYLLGLQDSKGSLLGLTGTNGESNTHAPLSNSTQPLLNDSSLLTAQPGIEKSGNELRQKRIKILYGTKTGNAGKIANLLHHQTMESKLSADLVDMNEYNPKDIKKEELILIVISTDGEGDPPPAAEEFYQYIFSKRVPRLEGKYYSVLALGDSSYQHYCKTGKDIDMRFEELGAERISKRVDCDLDFEEDAQLWIDSILEKFKNGSPKEQVSPEIHTSSGESVNKTVSKSNPGKAIVLEKTLLNGRGSTKETYHYELSIENMGISFSPGDSVGIYFKNPADLVNEIIRQAGFNASQSVEFNGNQFSIKDALTSHFEITTLTTKVVREFAIEFGNTDLSSVAADNNKLYEFTKGKDLLDIIQMSNATIDPGKLFHILRKLQPRLYSVASSCNANPDELHITVSTVRYQNLNRVRSGACSTYLADHIGEDDVLSVYIDENIGFRLPEDPLAPVIMIGAGTGIAPYRAFMQEREYQNASGKNWLFFGDRNFTTDFLYQLDWQKYLKKGLLTRMNVAFSRDQDNKVYVQDKIIQESADFFNWIEEGAFIYVCGDKDNMAPDVKNTIREIIRKEGNFSSDKAGEYMTRLRKQKRYLEDVY